MGAPLRITVRELNVQGEVWNSEFRNKNKKSPEQIKEQIINAFEKLTGAASDQAPGAAEQNCRDTSFDMDVIVLTAVSDEQWEVVRTSDELGGYEWIDSSKSRRHRAVIGVKKPLPGIISETAPKSTEDMELLRVRFGLASGKTVTVIGCRMTTGGEAREQYKSEGKAFDEQLVPFIVESVNDAGCDICIVAGDFNNARCHGDLNLPYDPADYAGLDTVDYNLNIIKDKFADMGFRMADIGENARGIGTLWYSKYRRYTIPDDHIFVRGAGLRLKRCAAVPTDDRSDHAVILAEFDAPAE